VGVNQTVGLTPLIVFPTSSLKALAARIDFRIEAELNSKGKTNNQTLFPLN